MKNGNENANHMCHRCDLLAATGVFFRSINDVQHLSGVAHVPRLCGFSTCDGSFSHLRLNAISRHSFVSSSTHSNKVDSCKLAVPTFTSLEAGVRLTPVAAAFDRQGDQAMQALQLRAGQVRIT